MPKKTYRVGVIGATGRGGYGHGLDTAFQDVPRAEIVAVADADEQGRIQTAKKLRVTTMYADYHEMLERALPDVVCIGPTWLTDRLAMIEAAAELGCHIYCEKPLAFDLASSDLIYSLCEKHKTKLALAHQWRGMPPVQQTLRDLREGKYGRILRMRARPKDDARGGGEELLIHGTHWFDLMIAIAGLPRWVSGQVLVGERLANLADRREGSMPVGPIWGDSILSVFGFDRGILGTFDTTTGTAPYSRNPPVQNPAWDSVFGLTVECENATLQWRQPGDVFVYPAPGNFPDLEQLKWNRVWIEDWHFTKEHQPRPLRQQWLHLGNQALAADLIDAIEEDRNPLSPYQHGAWITEMVQGTYASHFAEGKRLAIPLENRVHPSSS